MEVNRKEIESGRQIKEVRKLAELKNKEIMREMN